MTLRVLVSAAEQLSGPQLSVAMTDSPPNSTADGASIAPSPVATAGATQARGSRSSRYRRADDTP